MTDNCYQGMNQGWICPKCGKSTSPNSISCPFCDRVTAVPYPYSPTYPWNPYTIPWYPTYPVIITC